MAVARSEGEQQSTANALEAFHREAYAESLGVDEYLLKPIPLGRLVNVAAELIEKAEREDEEADAEAEKKSPRDKE